MTFPLPQITPLGVTAVVGGYLSGSVPYGLILSRLAGIGDIRKEGSGNIGATNVLRVGGKRLGAITLVLDMLKGAVPVLIAKQFSMDYAVMTALAAFFGHLFPVWLKFKGGKGVATGIGVSLALSPLLGLLLVAVWLMVAGATKYSSLAALTAFGLAPFLALKLPDGIQLSATMLVLAIVIWIRHHANIGRLMKGEESKMDLGKKPPPDAPQDHKTP
jgi:glycerol-3-phosphate acyltransferase PlsY